MNSEQQAMSKLLKIAVPLLLALLAGSGGTMAVKGITPTPEIVMPPEFTKLMERMALSEADRQSLHKADDSIMTTLEGRIDKLEGKLDQQTQLIMQLMSRVSVPVKAVQP